jgi:Domain of unknown function (DUF4326)
MSNQAMKLAGAAGADDNGPVRLQLSRRIGFDLQRVSQSRNGRPAVNCARPTKWGNKHKIGSLVITVDAQSHRTKHELTAEDCCRMHREDLAAMRPADRAVLLESLRAKNLACWCDPKDPHCHVINLLEFANR